MKKVYLHFKEYELGFLIQNENVYVWIPNSDMINICFKRYDGAKDIFLLNAKETTVYENIPYHFDEFLVGAERTDLAKSANIKKLDSDFDKLYKMAMLDYFNQDFYISV